MWIVRPVYRGDLSGIVYLFRVQTGLRAMRDSCRPWSRTSRTKSPLSLPKKACAPPSWTLRASQRKWCILHEMHVKKQLQFILFHLAVPWVAGRVHLCASRGRLDCLEVIIALGADLNMNDGNGERFDSTNSYFLNQTCVMK